MARRALSFLLVVSASVSSGCVTVPLAQTTAMFLTDCASLHAVGFHVELDPPNGLPLDSGVLDDGPSRWRFQRFVLELGPHRVRATEAVTQLAQEKWFNFTAARGTLNVQLACEGASAPRLQVFVDAFAWTTPLPAARVAALE